MLLGLAAAAFAHEPVLLPLTEEPWVDSSPVAASVTGGAAFSEGASAAGALGIEANVAERASVALEAGVDSRATAPLLGASARVNVLSGDAGDLGVAARYKRQGWQGSTGELEALVAVSRDIGKTTALLDAVFGAELGDPGKDAELTAATLTRLSEALSLGGDVRGRLALDSNSSADTEAEGDAEEQERYEVVAGPVANIRIGPATGMLQVGGQLLGLPDGAATGLVASAGARIGF